MNAERWQEISRLYHAALTRTPDERAAFFEKECPDHLLRCEIESLLLHNKATGLLPAALTGELTGPLGPTAATSLIGRHIGPYHVLLRLGVGGMGEVYRARDSKLGRDVALKILPDAFISDSDRLARFEREARLLATLNHPHVAAIYGFEQSDGMRALVLELVEGETLEVILARGPLEIERAIDYASQIADALAAAHASGIVHRDLKPSNVMVTHAGVKVLDFGVAKRFDAIGAGALTTVLGTAEGRTQPGQIVGTAAYMSPEQAEGGAVDARSDVFAFGVLFYEMLCGKRPFNGTTTLATLASILRASPDPPRSLRPEIPANVEHIVLRCLDKRPDGRYESGGAVHRELLARQTARMRVRASRRPAVITALIAVLIVLAVIGVRSYVNVSRVRWVKTEVVPELARLAGANRLLEALRLHREASGYVPASRELEGFAETLRARQFSIRTDPPGATIYVADYVDVGKGGSEAGRPQWVELGVSPLDTNTIPTRGYYRVRVEKAGFVPIEQAFGAIAARPLELRLNSEATSPPGMVWIPGIRAGESLSWEVVAPVALPGYWLDRYEVTNREFKTFVTAGGYQKPEYWKEPFVKDGQSLSWKEAMAQFRDATGRVGPATWELGTYRDATADLPVGGVSWYEAAAFAAFSSRSLPTIYHWFGAAGIRLHSDILGLSNFRGKAPDPVGRNRGVTTFGAFDMAGNVKEWVANPVGDRRFILGGGWDEPAYQFAGTDGRKPFERNATFGFRRALYGPRPPDAVAGPLALKKPDRRGDVPAGDDEFRIYAVSHGYDKADLQSRVESVDTSRPHIRKETVSFRAAYGDERVISHLYLPKEGTPPYQIVFFVPGASIFTVRSVDALSDPFEFLVRSGRAVMITALKGTLERIPSGLGLLGPNDLRDRLLQMSKDVQRSIDYMETRPKDIDVGKLAYYGLSGGGSMSPLWLAVEKRIKTAVLVSTGTLQAFSTPAAVDPWNYVPRVKIPVLMLNGRDDFTFPLESHQKPFFEALGSAPTEKRHRLFDGGHVNVTTRPDVIKEFLDWLDRYLGPTERTE